MAVVLYKLSYFKPNTTDPERNKCQAFELYV